MLSHPEAPCFLIEENFFRVRESLTRDPRHPAEVDRVWKIPDLEKCLARVTSESIKKADASLRPAPAVPDTTSERGILLVLPCKPANQSSCRWIMIKTELSIAGSHSWTRLTQILDSEHNTYEILRHHFHRWTNYLLATPASLHSFAPQLRSTASLHSFTSTKRPRHP